MNIRDFYETVILRDILEYFSPGVILLGALSGILDTFLVEVGIMKESFFWGGLLKTALNNTWIAFCIVLFSGAYSGHFLTAFAKITGLFKERNEVDKKDEKTFDFFLKHNSELPSKNFETNFAKTELREITRGIVEIRQPELFRVYVLRHSIFSRFSQNLALAGGICGTLSIVFVVVLFFVSGWKIGWSLVGAAFGSLCVWILFRHRYSNLRQTMNKHTFQLLLVDTIVSSIKSNTETTD